MPVTEPKFPCPNADAVAESALLAELAEHLDGAGVIVDQALTILHANAHAGIVLNTPAATLVGASFEPMLARGSHLADTTVGPRLKAAVRQREPLTADDVCIARR